MIDKAKNAAELEVLQAYRDTTRLKLEDTTELYELQKKQLTARIREYEARIANLLKTESDV